MVAIAVAMTVAFVVLILATQVIHMFPSDVLAVFVFVFCASDHFFCICILIVFCEKFILLQNAVLSIFAIFTVFSIIGEENLQ